VLLADDHQMILDGLRALLSDHATVLGCYADGAALLQGTLKHHPEIVITDVSMPKLSGLEYLRAIRKTPVAPRVIILSVYGTDALACDM
jgi:DNA-binding NarL/FixJ family response regulator